MWPGTGEEGTEAGGGQHSRNAKTGLMVHMVYVFLLHLWNVLWRWITMLRSLGSEGNRLQCWHTSTRCFCHPGAGFCSLHGTVCFSSSKPHHPQGYWAFQGVWIRHHCSCYLSPCQLSLWSLVFWLFVWFDFFFKDRSYYIALTGLKLGIFISQPLKCWNYTWNYTCATTISFKGYFG